MLILPPGHAEATRVGRRLTVREKRLIGAVLGVLAALVVALVVSISTGGHTSARGCIYVTIPAATGAQEIYQCGSTASDTCSTVRTPGAYAPEAARSVETECRRAGLPIGP